MGLIVFAYVAVVLATSIPAIWHGDYALGFSGLVAPLLCMIAGGAVPDGLRDRTIPTFGVLVIAALMIGGSLYWVSSTGWHVVAFSASISGVALCLVGIILGWFFEGIQNARKALAEERSREIGSR